MSLKSEITRTETNKINLTNAKNGINNKLIEIGGQSAVDLNNVPEKIERALKDYRRVVIGTTICKDKDATVGSYEKPMVKKIHINAGFNIKRLIAFIGYGYDFLDRYYDSTHILIDSTVHNSDTNFRNSETFGKLYVSKLDNGAEITYIYTNVLNAYYMFYIALG